MIELSQLEAHLWESANILRGPVDAADFKTYIFPLLFFKRICDVWDEEFREIAEEMGDPELANFPESHRFQIPDGCHWNQVRETSANVGSALQRALREIEKANPDTLYGVFGDAQWTNRERLSEGLPARHRGFPDRAWRHAAQPRLLRGRPPRQVRLRHR